jgi:chorismate synthase
MAESPAAIERSDVCAVPAAAVVGEAMVCLVLADALIEKFGGDTVQEIDAACRRYAEALSARLAPGVGHARCCGRSSGTARRGCRRRRRR